MNFFLKPFPAGRGKIQTEQRAVRDAIQSLTIRKSPNVRATTTPTGTTIKTDSTGTGTGNNVPRWG
jgi:hypothetical protein